MRQSTKTIILCLIANSVCATAAFAEGVNVDWDASVRLRGEARNDLDFSDSQQDFTLLRSRVGAKFTLAPQWSISAELQDSRIFDVDANTTPNINDNALDQPFADDLDIHRLALNYLSKNFRVTLGRQKLNLGDQRLVASLEWVNTARVNDGIRVDYKKDNLEINAFATELVSINPSSFNDGADTGNRRFDSQFNGAFIEQKKLGKLDVFQGWWFQRRNSDFDDDVHTFGIRVQEQISSWTLEAQAALQIGDFGGNDHDAALFQASVSKSLGAGVASLGVAWASGDDDPNDGESETFDNLYPLNHAYYGFIDLFSLQNLATVELSYRRPLLNKKLKFRAALHGFWLDNENDFWYEAGFNPIAGLFVSPDRINNAERFLGSELDITFQYDAKINGLEKVSLLAGYSYFDLGDRVQVDPTNGRLSNTDFIFLQLNLKL